MKYTTLLLLTLGAFAAQEIDLSFLKGLEAKAKESTNIDLGPDQLGLLMGLAANEAPELKALGKQIERVQVRTLEFDKEGEFNPADLDKLRESIKTSNFVPLISVKERKGFTEIGMRKEGDRMRGFVILSVEPKEITVVNILGNLDMATLGKLSGKFGIPNVQMGPSSGGKAKKDDEDE